MPDPMTAGMLPPFDPSQVPAWEDLQRKQMLAGMLMGAMQRSNQTPPDWNSMKVVPRRGLMTNIAPLVSGLMAGGATGQALGAQQKYLQGLLGPQPPSQPQPSNAAPTQPATPQGPSAAPSGGMPQGPANARDAYSPVTPEDIGGVSVPGLPPARSIPYWAQMNGKDPIAAMESYRNQQKAMLAQQRAPDVARLDSLINSDHPAQYALSDDAFMQRWPQLAQSMGLDPSPGSADFKDQNVRRALGMLRNPLAASVGLPEKATPEQKIPVTGAFGYRAERDPVTNEEKSVQGADLPTYTYVDRYDPKSGATVHIPIQSGGWFPGMSRGVGEQPTGPSAAPQIPSAPSPTSAAPAAVAGAPARTGGGGPSTVDLGMGTPKSGEFESAGYAQYMRGGMQGVQKLESQGYGLPPAARAVVIDVATNEEGGITSQILRQEMLKHGLSLGGPQAQEYLASLMPMLQAAGHAMAGAKLTAGQMRTNFESLIPLDVKNKDAMGQINLNRQNFYSSLLGQAGGAVRSPLYQSTLGSDFDHIKAGHKQVKGQWYEQRGDGKIYPAGQ